MVTCVSGTMGFLFTKPQVEMKLNRRSLQLRKGLDVIILIERKRYYFEIEGRKQLWQTTGFRMEDSTQTVVHAEEQTFIIIENIENARFVKTAFANDAMGEGR